MNFIKPGKRPQSSVSPAIVHSTLAPCDLRIAIGATNGSKIPTGKVSFIWHDFWNEWENGLLN